MEEHTKSISEYIAIIKDKKWTAIAISSVVMLVAITIAIVLPPTYRSSSTILIEQQDIPTDLVRSTVTSYASERIQTIQAQVMSRTNLLKIIDKFDLYVDDRKTKTTDEIIGHMREDTNLNVISADVVDPRTGRPGQATIAFELSFEGESPRSVQRVATELTSLYLNENLKSRSKKADETASFLNEESIRLGNQISELERKLAEFKEKNADLLPGLQQFNMQMLQRTETEHASLVSSIQSVKEQKFYLEGRLLAMSSDIPGAADRLTVLESEYAVARARYSSDHPDLQRLKREIDILKNRPEVTESKTFIDNEIKKLQLELLQLNKKYSESHPDIIRVREKLSSLENKPEKSLKEGITDPSYVALKTQIEGMAIELRLAEERKTIAKNKIIKLENILLNMPKVEQEYLALTRDYDNAVLRYQDTKAKGMQAEVAKQLETEQKGERFTLIDPAGLPEKPIKPNRAAIIFLGFILSLGGGIGFVLVSDLLSGVVRGAKHIEALIGLAPLSVIPLQLNASDLIKKIKFKKRTLLISVFSVIIILSIVHFFISPLDVIWFRLLRKLERVVS